MVDELVVTRSIVSIAAATIVPLALTAATDTSWSKYAEMSSGLRASFCHFTFFRSAGADGVVSFRLIAMF
jgi:hypothetical protein